MERWILIVCHERPQLADLQGEWQKKGISARIVQDAGEAAGELSGNTDYLLVIIFSDGRYKIVNMVLESVEVHDGGLLYFHFLDGTELEIETEEE